MASRPEDVAQEKSINADGESDPSEEQVHLVPKPHWKEGPPPICCPCLPWDPYPYFVLLFIMFITFGSYWVFDAPGAILTQLQTWFGGPDKYTRSMNLNLYSVYSYPNMILCFFGGYIIDRITGVRLGSIIFCGFILLGEMMFCLGIQFKIYYLALVGRFVFGLGGESLTVAQNTYTARWFDGKQLALAFGLVLSFSRIGSSVNFAVTPYLTRLGVPVAIWFGGATCVFSFAACVVLASLDWYGKAKVKKVQASEETISFRHILRFPFSTWIIYGICVFFYIGVLTFYTVASDIMQHTGHQFSEDTATLFISIPNFVSIVAAPLFGFLVDRFGRSVWWIILSSAMLVVAHVMFLANANEWFFLHPIPIMLWLGFGYALLAASLWPLLPYIIQPNMLGTAYGAMTAVQNAGLAVFPQIIGALQDANGIAHTRLQYTIPILIFIGCTGIAFGLGWLLLIIDKARHGGILNATGKEKQAWRDRRDAAVKAEENRLAAEAAAIKEQEALLAAEEGDEEKKPLLSSDAQEEQDKPLG
jgi:MFS family permease